MNNTLFFQIMIFYSAITFFICPKLTKMMNIKSNDPCFIGMILGFLVCLFLWKQYGYEIVYKGKMKY